MQENQNQVGAKYYQIIRLIHTHTLVHRRCRHNSHKVETGQMPTSDWMDKQTVVDPLNGTVFNHNQEWSTDAYYNMREPQKHA